MAERRDEIIRGTVVLDGASFVKCEFKDAVLVYKGGTPPNLDQCKMTNTRMVFEDAAGNTINFLRGMAQPKSSMRQLVLNMMPELAQN